MFTVGLFLHFRIFALLDYNGCGVHHGRHNFMIADLDRWPLFMPFGGAFVGRTGAKQRRLPEHAAYKL